MKLRRTKNGAIFGPPGIKPKLFCFVALRYVVWRYQSLLSSHVALSDDSSHRLIHEPGKFLLFLELHYRRCPWHCRRALAGRHRSAVVIRLRSCKEYFLRCCHFSANWFLQLERNEFRICMWTYIWWPMLGNIRRDRFHSARSGAERWPPGTGEWSDGSSWNWLCTSR